MKTWSRGQISIDTSRITKIISRATEIAIEAAITENADIHGTGRCLHLSTFKFFEEFGCLGNEALQTVASYEDFINGIFQSQHFLNGKYRHLFVILNVFLRSPRRRGHSRNDREASRGSRSRDRRRRSRSKDRSRRPRQKIVAMIKLQPLFFGLWKSLSIFVKYYSCEILGIDCFCRSRSQDRMRDREKRERERERRNRGLPPIMDNHISSQFSIHNHLTSFSWNWHYQEFYLHVWMWLYNDTYVTLRGMTIYRFDWRMTFALTCNR